MSEYPEDIMKAAEDLFERKAEQMESIKGCIALLCEAILAERERCEKIALNEADRICDNDNDYSGPRVYDMIVTARRIQFAISGKPNIHLSDDVRARITKTIEDAA